MVTTAEFSGNGIQDSKVKSILEWLAIAHGRPQGAESADPLHRQLLLLRESPIPGPQRVKLLDLLYSHCEQIVRSELPRLQEIALPITRRQRQRVRALLDLLEAIAQDYFNTLAELFDPEAGTIPKTPHLSLRRAMHAISWQIRIYHLIGAPPPPGLWQQLHAGYRTARRLGVTLQPDTPSNSTIHDIYTATLLAAIAQPASFSSRELQFIADYITGGTPSPVLYDSPPADDGAVFWIDPDKDFPAYALVRRAPTSEPEILYFSCTPIAETACRHREQLISGTPAASLSLPDFASSHAGLGVLKRLAKLWGHPVKRKFPRRRQSYRALLCTGMSQLLQLARTPEQPPDSSEWMVINESPDGYSLMHMSGETQALKVGDIVAIHALGERAEATHSWHVCIIRWAISENPEHIELGLQVLAARAIAAEIAHPNMPEGGNVNALILPETPPLRPREALVLPTGLLRENTRRIIVLIEKDNLEIREVQATHLDEQTSSIEIFSVLPDDSP